MWRLAFLCFYTFDFALPAAELWPFMSLEVKIPSVGESISSGVIAAWHKKDGDQVQANDPILTLETDKVSSEIVAPGTGRLTLQAKEAMRSRSGRWSP